MAPRANWKGYLKIEEVTCPVALYTAASQSDRIAFHTLNRATGHRVKREFIDSETGDPVAREDQVKGYAVGEDSYVVLEPEEIAGATPDSDKTLAISAFIPCDTVDTLFLERPYYLAPSDQLAQETFGLLREAMRESSVAAIAQTVLFRRVRSLLIRPDGNGMIASTLNFDYEVRPPDEVFGSIGAPKIEGEMLDLAEHIIATKKGRFDPTEFDDRYEQALTELVKAKMEGRSIPRPRIVKPTEAGDLLAALRKSTEADSGASRRPPARKTGAQDNARRRKKAS